MAAYGRVTLNRGGRNSRFDCILKPVQKLHCLSQNAFDKDSMTKRHMNIHADLSVYTV